MRRSATPHYEGGSGLSDGPGHPRRGGPSSGSSVWSAASRGRPRDVQSRGTSAWFAELGVDVRTAEELGDRQFDRVRAPLFEMAKRPHRFTAEERRRMDQYESIDYSEAHSFVYKVEMSERQGEKRWLKWALFIVVGVAVGLWSMLLFQTLEFVADAKVEVTAMFVRENALLTAGRRTGSGVPLVAAAQGLAVHVAWSVLAAVLSALCCVVMPSAAGSGVPDVMAYLNGIMLPRIFNIRNLVAKTLSCILAVSSGLPVGAEGPIIHIGSLIAAGLPTGRSRTLQCSATSLLSGFRNPKDSRDFISAGAACGMTSAFSCPIGGLLFVMEEMATFFPVRLAWLVFVSCLSCMCTIQVINTYFAGWRLTGGATLLAPGTFRDSAISMFLVGTSPGDRVPMNLYTLLPTVAVSVPLALLAVAYTIGSVRLTRWRSRWLFPKAVLRVMEPCVFVAFYATLVYSLAFALPCVPVPPYVAENRQTLGVELVSFMCADPQGTFSPLGTLGLTSAYNGIRVLYSRHTEALIPWYACAIHLAVYAVGSMYAGGMFISCGTVIPSFFIGALGGRLGGLLFAGRRWSDPGVVALIGSAAYFAGVSRLTFSLVVIVMELTSDVTHLSCLTLGVIGAKVIADRCCHSLYHALLEAKAAPFLEAQADVHKLDTYAAKHIMTSPVVTLRSAETVIHLVEVLKTTTHHAYPVVTLGNGTYRGMIQRSQLELLLSYIFLRDTGEAVRGGVAPLTLPITARPHATFAELRETSERIFWERLPPLPPMEYLPLETLRSAVDLTPYTDLGAYYVRDGMCISRTYYIFRYLGLRHLPVLSRNHKVIGIVTRTNLVGDRLFERLRMIKGDARARRVAAGSPPPTLRE